MIVPQTQSVLTLTSLFRTNNGWRTSTLTTAKTAFVSLGSWTVSTTAGCASKSTAESVRKSRWYRGCRAKLRKSVRTSRYRWWRAKLRKSGFATSVIAWRNKWIKSRRAISRYSIWGRGTMQITQHPVLPIIRKLISPSRGHKRLRPSWGLQMDIKPGLVDNNSHTSLKAMSSHRRKRRLQWPLRISLRQLKMKMVLMLHERFSTNNRKCCGLNTLKGNRMMILRVSKLLVLCLETAEWQKSSQWGPSPKSSQEYFPLKAK